MSLFFSLIHLKVLDYKVPKVLGVCLYYSILQGPDRVCVAFYAHDCIRWIWKNCEIKLSETSTHHPVVGPEHLSGRHVARPSSFNHGSLHGFLQGFAGDCICSIVNMCNINTNLPGLSLFSATLGGVFLKSPGYMFLGMCCIQIDYLTYWNECAKGPLWTNCINTGVKYIPVTDLFYCLFYKCLSLGNFYLNSLL